MPLPVHIKRFFSHLDFRIEPLFLHFLYMVHKFYKLDTIAIEKRRVNLTLFFSGTLLSCKIVSICSPIARFNSRRCASHLNASMVMSLDWNKFERNKTQGLIGFLNCIWKSQGMMIQLWQHHGFEHFRVQKLKLGQKGFIGIVQR